MTRFDDELDYVCAWGRWRIGQARNEPTAGPAARHGPDARVRARCGPAVTRPAGRLRPANRARLRLVTVGGALLAARRLGTSA
jgi:hypothetical protein